MPVVAAPSDPDPIDYSARTKPKARQTRKPAHPKVGADSPELVAADGFDADGFDAMGIHRDIADLVPEPRFMAPMWLGCVHWALGEPAIVARYRADTGDTYEPARTPIDRMVDEACGRPSKFMRSFIVWVNANLWGSVNDRGDASV